MKSKIGRKIFNQAIQTDQYFNILRSESSCVYASSLSDSGQTLECLQFGLGRNKVLIVADIHPNEPIGRQTVAILAEEFKQGLFTELDVELYIVPSLERDGVLRNTWRKAPFSLTEFCKQQYIPEVDAQADFQFSLLPSTNPQQSSAAAFLQSLIDTLQPDIYVPLHNDYLADGYYCFLSECTTDFYTETVQEAKELNFELSMRYEHPSVPIRAFAHGYYEPLTPELFSYLLGRPMCTSYHYAREKWGSSVLVPEVPLFLFSQLTTELPDESRDVFLRGLALVEQAGQDIRVMHYQFWKENFNALFDSVKRLELKEWKVIGVGGIALFYLMFTAGLLIPHAETKTKVKLSELVDLSGAIIATLNAVRPCYEESARLQASLVRNYLTSILSGGIYGSKS